MFVDEGTKIYWGGKLLYEKSDTPDSIKERYGNLTEDEKQDFQTKLLKQDKRSNIYKKLGTLLDLEFSNILRF